MKEKVEGAVPRTDLREVLFIKDKERRELI